MITETLSDGAVGVAAGTNSKSGANAKSTHTGTRSGSANRSLNDITANIGVVVASPFNSEIIVVVGFFNETAIIDIGDFGGGGEAAGRALGWTPSVSAKRINGG